MNNQGPDRTSLPAGVAVLIDDTTEPADAEISAGQLYLFFDPTNGAAKFKLKGKSLNGTVVVGEVDLT